MSTRAIADEAKINELLSRGVEDVFIFDDLKKKLLSGEVLNIKFGIDPTGPTIHLGRATVLRKLRAFQDLGHEITLIIGDFTAQIGDPSDKLSKRPMLTREKIEENLKDYKNILGKIIDLKKTKFVYNSEWLGKLGFQEISQLAEAFTVQQMLARRNFKDRLDKGEEISLRETLYPLMQGYDSVAIKSDVEIGGFDQLFNLKAGRIIQKHYGEPEQNVLTCQMLEGTDGRKMSTSWGNVINITDEPNDMYGKIMSMRDELIGKYFLLCTDLPVKEIEEIEQKMKDGSQNPKEAKMLLARTIVAFYHNDNAAAAAEEYFATAFQKKEIPDDIKETEVTKGEKLVDVLIEQKIVASKSEFRRLVEDKAVDENGVGLIEDVNFAVERDGIFKIGKRRFLKIKLK